MTQRRFCHRRRRGGDCVHKRRGRSRAILSRSKSRSSIAVRRSSCRSASSTATTTGRRRHTGRRTVHDRRTPIVPINSPVGLLVTLKERKEERWTTSRSSLLLPCTFSLLVALRCAFRLISFIRSASHTVSTNTNLPMKHDRDVNFIVLYKQNV